ncbi:MAG: hypothetical protein ACHQWV_01830, partial [Nitrospirales bacterium]
MLVAMGLVIAPMTSRAESPSVIEVAKFSSGTVGQAMPDGWKPLTFKKIPKQTLYEFEPIAFDQTKQALLTLTDEEIGIVYKGVALY